MRENDANETEIERLLTREGLHPVPRPRPDLVSRTLKRIQNWVVMGDLLRLVTLEGLWTAFMRRKRDAKASEERQDS